MIVETLVLGYLDNNTYILKKDGKSLVIDPSCDYDKIKKALEGTKLLGVLVTHDHPDHIGALDDLIEDKKVKVLEKQLAPFEFEIIPTPGHTSDSKTFYFKEDKLMFTGDFLFKETIGRTDLPTGDYKVMMESIKMIKKYPNCTVYPGHGESTTLKHEKENNGYFNE